jgi:hypothetical protein
VNETAFPTLPDYPRDDAVCNDFTSFFSDGLYSNSMTLEDDSGGVAALFQYNVTSDGAIEARLAYDGIFGYLSFGFQGEGGRLTMHNAPIVLAMRAGGYTPQYGINLTTEPEVHEYVTNKNYTAFRFWNFPYDDNGTTATGGDSHYSVRTESDGCYTSLLFHGSSISGKEFNLNGTDTLIWAANSNDTFMQYHGVERGNFLVDWTVKSSSPLQMMNSGTYIVMSILAIVSMNI